MLIAHNHFKSIFKQKTLKVAKKKLIQYFVGTSQNQQTVNKYTILSEINSKLVESTQVKDSDFNMVFFVV